jgi:hypothetical protein
MTSQETAQDLVNRHLTILGTQDLEIAKQMALVSVERIIEELTRLRNRYFQLYSIPFWEAVKESIQTM